MSDPNKAVSVIYVERSGKPTIPVTGAYGGLTSDGMSVIAHLYTEFSSIPTAVKVEVSDDKPPSETIIAMKSDGVREVQASVVMSPETAKAIGHFLIQKAELAQSVRPKG